jgi:DNA-binding transcriptional LysR family regulator
MHEESDSRLVPLRELGLWFDLRHLQALVEVGLGGSLTAAAEALSYTPSGISRQIAALERDVGFPLVARSGRSLRLTRAGWELAMRGARILHETRMAQEALARHRGLHAEPAPIDADELLRAMLLRLDQVYAQRRPWSVAA